MKQFFAVKQVDGTSVRWEKGFATVEEAADYLVNTFDLFFCRGGLIAHGTVLKSWFAFFIEER